MKPQTGKANAKELSFSILDSGYRSLPPAVRKSAGLRLSSCSMGQRLHSGPTRRTTPPGFGRQSRMRPEQRSFSRAPRTRSATCFTASGKRPNVAIATTRQFSSLGFGTRNMKQKRMPNGTRLKRGSNTKRLTASGADKPIGRGARIASLPLRPAARQMNHAGSSAKNTRPTPMKRSKRLVQMRSSRRKSSSKPEKQKVDGYGPIILGVDPARGGGDKTGIVDRQGRRIGGHLQAHRQQRPYGNSRRRPRLLGELARQRSWSILRGLEPDYTTACERYLAKK